MKSTYGVQVFCASAATLFVFALTTVPAQSITVPDSSFETPVTSAYQDNTGIAPGSAIPNTIPSNAWFYLGGFTASGSPVGIQNVAANGFTIKANPDGTQDAYVNVGAWMSSGALATIAPDTTYTLTVWEGNRGGNFPQTGGFTIALAYGASVSTGLTNSANWASSLHVAYTNSPAVGTFAPFQTSFTTGPSDASIGQSLYVLLGSDATSGANPIDYDLVQLTATPDAGPTHTIVFSPTAPGVTRAITNWGLDTCWPSYDNMLRGLRYMGTNNVTIVRVGFFVDAPLTNNDVTAADKSAMQTDINLAGMATDATRWDLNLDSSVSSWYQSGSGTVYPDRWAAAMEACQRYYDRPFWAAEGFNEPDYSPNGEGSPQNLDDIFGYLQSSTNFSGTRMEGGSTLNDDNALSWFNTIWPRATIGSTHCLAGSAASYVNFIQSVAASNALPFNPELHNVCEAIMGANYGLYGGIWWGTAERARGDFVKACQGKQLGYADDLNNWTAAAVYRAPSGAVQGFFGGSERMAVTTSYWLFSKLPVFFDGYGPTHDYLVTVPGGTGYQQNQPDMERVVDITWGADVPPPINGRYLVVNRNSGLVLEVPGGSTNNGTILDQNTYSGVKYQQWDIDPLPTRFGGDVSYYTMDNVNSGVTADESGYSYADGNPIQQWNGGTNLVEQWYFQYAGNGYFYIRNRWSDDCVQVADSSSSASARIVQQHYMGNANQQWRLIPATVSTYHLTGAPAAPTGVTATAKAVSVRLNWNANTESDLAGYTVLRSTDSGGPYDIIARGLTNTTFTDGSVLPGQTYYYVVAADDRSLNQSADSSEASATPFGGQAMLAHYTFDNTSADSSGNGNNAELIGSPAYTVGHSGRAIMLNGAGQSVVVPGGIMNAATNYTIAAWVYWNGGNAWQRIFDFGNNTTQYMFLTPSSGSGTLRFAITTNGNGAEQQLNASPMPVGQWFHVAVAYDGATARLYTNGVLATSGNITISPADFDPVANFLGHSQFPTDPTLNGDLDDVYIFNYALSATQIAKLMMNQPPPPLAPTTLSTSFAGNSLNLIWPANYIGYRLESNSVGLTATNLWFTVSGSSLTDQISIPLDTTRTNVFFRLVYP